MPTGRRAVPGCWPTIRFGLTCTWQAPEDALLVGFAWDHSTEAADSPSPSARGGPGRGRLIARRVAAAGHVPVVTRGAKPAAASSAGVMVRTRRAGLACGVCLLYTSPSPRDGLLSRMPS